MSVYRGCLTAVLLAGVLLSGTPADVLAEGEHARRAGAELLVLQGDLRKLGDAVIPQKQKKGLKDRVRGGLAGLPLLLRLADEEVGREQQAVLPIRDYRALLQQGALHELRQRLLLLSERYPFRASGILPASAGRQRLDSARSTHAALCAGCHDSPYLEQERPAFNLFRQARTTPIREFAARMVVGIRGDRTTGIDNPFSDAELAALITYYRTPAN